MAGCSAVQVQPIFVYEISPAHSLIKNNRKTQPSLSILALSPVLLSMLQLLWWIIRLMVV